MNHPVETPDDDSMERYRGQVRALFTSTSDPAARDVVPAAGPTLDDLRRWSDATLTDEASEGTLPGELHESPFGDAVSVGPSQSVTGSLAGVAISQGAADRLGLTADDLARDYPGVNIAPPITKKKED